METGEGEEGKERMSGLGARGIGNRSADGMRDNLGMDGDLCVGMYGCAAGVGVVGLRMSRRNVYFGCVERV